jgi:hypothetical protein
MIERRIVWGRVGERGTPGWGRKSTPAPACFRRPRPGIRKKLFSSVFIFLVLFFCFLIYFSVFFFAPAPAPVDLT